MRGTQAFDGRSAVLTRRAFLESAAAATLANSLRGQIHATPRFGLAHLTVLGCSPPEVARIAGRAGYEYASFRTIPMGLQNEPVFDLARNAPLLRDTRTALTVNGVQLHDVEVARIAEGVDVKSYAPAIAVAAELGARRILASIWTGDRAAAVESLAKLCELAAESAMSVSLEFVTWASVANLRQAVGICRAVNRLNLGLLVDVLHFHRSRVTLAELDSIPRDWFHFAHVSDALDPIPSSVEELIRDGREARLYPGDGVIDIAAIVDRMPPVPYVLEIPNLERVKELGYAEHARRCLESARKYFAAHPRA